MSNLRRLHFDWLQLFLTVLSNMLGNTVDFCDIVLYVFDTAHILGPPRFFTTIIE